MEKTEIKTEIKVGPGVAFCDKCKEYFSTSVKKAHKYLKWNICETCYKPFQDNHNKIQIKKKKREALRKNIPLKEFKIEFHQAKDFKDLCSFLKNYVDEVQIIVSNKGIYISSSDPSRIMVSESLLNIEHFKNSEITGKTKIEINLDDLSQILDSIKDDDPLILSRPSKELLEIDETLKGKSILEIHSKEYVMRLIELDHDIETIPMNNLKKIKNDVQILLTLEEFSEIIKKAKLFGETIYFNQNKIYCGSQIGSFENILKPETLKWLNTSRKIKSFYSTGFLSHISKHQEIFESIEIFIKTDHPLRLNLSLKNGNINFFLAPRVEDDYFEDDEEDLF